MRPLLRPCAALGAMALLGVATPAGAATLSIDLDKDVYETGETVTMTITGDSQGESALGVQGLVHLDGLFSPTVSFYTPPSASPAPWLSGGATGECFPSGCLVMNMLYPVVAVPGTVDAAAEPFLYATVTATAGVPGSHSVTWETDSNTGFQLIFFGLTNAPGVTYTIVGDPLLPPPPLPPVIPPPSRPPNPPPVIPPHTPGGGSSGGVSSSGQSPIPEPTSALLFAVGVAAVRIRLRGARKS